MRQDLDPSFIGMHIDYDLPGRPAGGVESKLLDQKTLPDGLTYRQKVFLLQQRFDKGDKTTGLVGDLKSMQALIEASFYGISQEVYDRNAADAKDILNKIKLMLDAVPQAVVVPDEQLPTPTQGQSPEAAAQSPENRKFVPRNSFERALAAAGCPYEILSDPKRGEDRRSYFWTIVLYSMRKDIIMAGLQTPWTTLRVPLTQGQQAVTVPEIIESIDSDVPVEKGERALASEIKRKMSNEQYAIGVVLGRSKELLTASYGFENLYKFFNDGSVDATWFNGWFWEAIQGLPPLYVIDERGTVRTKKDAQTGKEEPIKDEKTLNVQMFQALRLMLRKGREYDAQGRLVAKSKVPESVDNKAEMLRLAKYYIKNLRNGAIDFVKRPLKFIRNKDTGILPLVTAKKGDINRQRNYDALLDEMKSPSAAAEQKAYPNAKVLDYSSEMAGLFANGLAELSCESSAEDNYGERPVGVTLLARLFNWQYFYKFLSISELEDGEDNGGISTTSGRPNISLVGGMYRFLTFFDYYGYDGKSIAQRMIEVEDPNAGFEVIDWSRLPKNVTSRWCETMKNYIGVMGIMHDGFKAGTIDTILKLEIEKQRISPNVPLVRQYLEVYRQLIGYLLKNDLTEQPLTNDSEPRPETGDFTVVRVTGVGPDGRKVQRDFQTRMFAIKNWAEPMIARWVDQKTEGDGKTARYGWRASTIQELRARGYDVMKDEAIKAKFLDEEKIQHLIELAALMRVNPAVDNDKYTEAEKEMVKGSGGVILTEVQIREKYPLSSRLLGLAKLLRNKEDTEGQSPAELQETLQKLRTYTPSEIMAISQNDILMTNDEICGKYPSPTRLLTLAQLIRTNRPTTGATVSEIKLVKTAGGARSEDEIRGKYFDPSRLQALAQLLRTNQPTTGYTQSEIELVRPQGSPLMTEDEVRGKYPDISRLLTLAQLLRSNQSTARYSPSEIKLVRKGDSVMTEDEIREKFYDPNKQTRLFSLRQRIDLNTTDDQILGNIYTKSELSAVRKIDLNICTIETGKKVQLSDEDVKHLRTMPAGREKDKEEQRLLSLKLVPPEKLLERQLVLETIYSASAEGDVIPELNADRLFVVGLMFSPAVKAMFEGGYQLGPLKQIGRGIAKRLPLLGRFFEIEVPRITPTDVYSTWENFMEFAHLLGVKITVDDIERFRKLIAEVGVR
ncbi:MAG TPA: hypothetical protein VFG51_03630 [Candidatus Saccharimonadia bacterium]|nr:hypothetical protein [Candidatus Saccharimonadia bacterium]